MKKIFLVLFLLAQMIMNIAHSCDVQDSLFNDKITSSSTYNTTSIDNHNCNDNSDQSTGNQCDNCIHCVASTVIIIPRTDHLSFNIIQLLTMKFYYSNQNYQSYLNVELQPPIFTV